MLIRDTGTQMACHAIVYAIQLHYYTVNSTKRELVTLFSRKPQRKMSPCPIK